jgi:hypothetical protein
MGNGLCRPNVTVEDAVAAAVGMAGAVRAAGRNPGGGGCEPKAAAEAAVDESAHMPYGGAAADSAAARAEAAVRSTASQGGPKGAAEAAVHAGAAESAAEQTHAAQAACAAAMAAARGGEEERGGGGEQRRWHVLVLGPPREGERARLLAARLLAVYGRCAPRAAARRQGLESRHLESRGAMAAARLDLEVAAGG